MLDRDNRYGQIWTLENADKYINLLTTTRVHMAVHVVKGWLKFGTLAMVRSKFISFLFRSSQKHLPELGRGAWLDL